MSEPSPLILYHATASSFSQKAVLALNYLNLKFDSRQVELFKGDQLEPWFLDINPKGEVPTLVDGDVTLCDSADILQYVNDTYDTRRSDEKLIPNPVTPLGRAVVEINQLICGVKTFMLTFGASFHPQHSKNALQSNEEREGRKTLVTEMPKWIQDRMANAVPPYKESYTYKLTKFATGSSMLKDENAFLEEIKSCGVVLEKIEEQLSKSKGKWIFSDFFTVADISLAVLLYRINKLGLQHHFWSEGTLPNVAAYFERVRAEPYVAKSLF